MKTISTLILALVVAGCAGRGSAIVSDIGDDKVKVQINMFTKRPQADATAQQSCQLYQKRAMFMSFRCMDKYCLNKEVLYACIK